MRYLTDCLGHDDLAALEISDAGRFRDYLFDQGVFSSVRAVINLAIREQGLAHGKSHWVAFHSGQQKNWCN